MQPPERRVSDRERDAATTTVRDAASDGRLDLAEVQDRIAAVLAARTHGDLEAAVGDLQRAGSPETPRQLVVRNSSITRSGPWRVPERLELRVQRSGVELDLREAVLESDVVTLDLDVTSSSVRIVAPPQVSVVQGDLRADGSAVTVPNRSDDDAEVVVVIAGSLRRSSLSVGTSRSESWWLSLLRRWRARRERRALTQGPG